MHERKERRRPIKNDLIVTQRMGLRNDLILRHYGTCQLEFSHFFMRHCEERSDAAINEA
jgi:hypothetical protein